MLGIVNKGDDMTMTRNLWILVAVLFAAITIIQLILIVNAAQAMTVCRPVGDKVFCYDSDADTNTTCRVVNGNLVCD